MTNLKSTLAARATALGLAAVFTFAMLGSMDFLATSEPAVGGVMAAASQPSA